MAVSDPSNPLNADSAADRALADYLDSLLHDGTDYANASLDMFGGDEPREPHSSAKVTPLPTAKRPPRLVEALKNLPEARPFAEPVRSLPLRMPPLAAPVETPSVETVPVAEAPVIETRVIETRVIEAPIEVVVEAVAAEVLPADDLSVGDTADAVQQARLAWAPNGRPQWAQQPFECLLFTSGGLTLAVPLVELGSIYPLEKDDLTEIFGQIDWFLGLIRTAYGNVRVIDTAQVVMPERYVATMADGYQYVVTLNNSDWGLGVDAVAGTTLLDPDAVRWRGQRSKRPWLAGTVIEKMCALLDPAQLSVMFNQMDRKRRK